LIRIRKSFKNIILYVYDKYSDEKEQIDNYLATIVGGSIKRIDDFTEETKLLSQNKNLTLSKNQWKTGFIYKRRNKYAESCHSGYKQEIRFNSYFVINCYY
jgi:hypothetical protein